MRDACGSDEVSWSSLGEIGPELNFLKHMHTYIRLFIYLAVSSLSCGMRDLHCGTWTL